jgi:hypothetical protein
MRKPSKAIIKVTNVDLERTRRKEREKRPNAQYGYCDTSSSITALTSVAREGSTERRAV